MYIKHSEGIHLKKSETVIHQKLIFHWKFLLTSYPFLKFLEEIFHFADLYQVKKIALIIILYSKIWCSKTWGINTELEKNMDITYIDGASLPTLQEDFALYCF